jgi:hypothetical protein
MTARDPATMTPDDRLVEIAEILATGYVRRISSTFLDSSGRVVASWIPAVVDEQPVRTESSSTTRKESA